MTHEAPPSEIVRARLTSELALPSRLGHSALLVLSLAGAALVAALLLTETALPLRTKLTLLALFATCVAWFLFAWWVLARRRVLYAQQSVVAAWLAIAVSLCFIVGSTLVGVQRSSGVAWLVAPATGIGMLVVAVLRLHSGQRRVALLTRRRAELEHAMRSES